MVTLNRLVDMYIRWGNKQKLSPLGSATEELFNNNLSTEQFNWLMKFVTVWDYAENKEHDKWKSHYSQVN